MVLTGVIAWVMALQLSSADVVSRNGPRAGEHVVGEVVASMEPEGAAPRFVLRGDLVLSLRVEMVMRGAPEPLVGVFHSSVVWGVLEQLVGEQLAMREAERTGTSEVSAEQVEEMRRWLLLRLGGARGLGELLHAAGVGEQEFEALLRRRVVSERLLQARHVEGTEPEEAVLRQMWERVRALRSERGDGGVEDSVRGSVRLTALRSELGASIDQWEPSREALRVDAVRYGAAASLRAWVRSLGSRVRLRVFRTEGE